MKITRLETFSNAWVGFVRVTTEDGAIRRLGADPATLQMSRGVH